MKQNSLINSIVKIEKKEKETLKNVFLVFGGVAFLAVMSQIAIYLPNNPVPISLGTFGVTLMALLYGRKLGTATIISYVTAGSLGIPIFANLRAGLLFSPTGGYIFGYIVATLILGYLADKGFTKSYIKTVFALIIAHISIYLLGVFQLSLFLTGKNVFEIGVLPFLLGDTLKIITVAALIPTLWKVVKRNN